MDTKNQPQSLLNDFLKELETIPSQLTDALLNNASDEDEKNIINSLSPTLKIQFQEISNSINESSKKFTRLDIANTEQFLKNSAALSITKSFKLALPSIGSLFGKLGLQEIIFAIKKIIRALFKKMPDWLNILLDIIDEIINMLFGKDSSKTKNMLSMAEQNFLKEITLVARLNKIDFSNEISEEED
jgi:hypothetical protein